jgi:hypothetical protein
MDFLEVVHQRQVKIGLVKVKKYMMADRSVKTLNDSTMLKRVAHSTNQIPA